ncbi:MAG: hypothetical protein WD894_06075 [Pirellulales bacterium]
MKRCSLVALALLLFAVFSTTALAGNREIRFYLSEAFAVPDGFRGTMDRTELSNRLTAYVSRMNAIFQKNTSVTLVYTPANHLCPSGGSA